MGTMERWLKYQEKYYKNWELDLDKTGYQEEIKKFWDEVAEKEVPKQLRYFPGESSMLD
jgi:hypothetical protein